MCLAIMYFLVVPSLLHTYLLLALTFTYITIWILGFGIELPYVQVDLFALASSLARPTHRARTPRPMPRRRPSAPTPHPRAKNNERLISQLKSKLVHTKRTNKHPIL